MADKHGDLGVAVSIHSGATLFPIVLTEPPSASYYGSYMVLLLVARNRLLDEPQSIAGHSSLAADADSIARSQMAEDKLLSAIQLAHKAAELLRDFRERYGLKITPAWLLQLQGVAAGILVLDPDLAAPIELPSPGVEGHGTKIEDSHTAFDEVFRCLLGTGVEVMIARGIARMMYHTALEKKITLSHDTSSVLQIMSDTAWRPSDLSMVNSMYPNFATTKDHTDSERMTELLSKWEKLEI